MALFSKKNSKDEPSTCGVCGADLPCSDHTGQEGGQLREDWGTGLTPKHKRLLDSDGNEEN